jgi:hypothetical protein
VLRSATSSPGIQHQKFDGLIGDLRSRVDNLQAEATRD